MAAETFPAKVSKPRVSGSVVRKRLFTALDACSNKPVVWVTGPAGAGKTTLVSGWLEANKHSFIWFQADQGDADISSFFHYLSIGARKAVTGRKIINLPTLTPEYFMDLQTFSLRYFEALFLKLPRPFFLVLDNYQDVPESSGLHDILTGPFQSLPEGITVIGISRRPMPQAFSRLRAGGMQCSIDWTDLKFSLQETKEIAQNISSGKLAEETIRQLHKAADGWAAGLVLLLEKLKNDDMDMETIQNISKDEIFDFFAYEAFRRLEPNVQLFLMKTSVLPEVSPEAAEKLTGISSAGSVLADLAKNQFFTLRQDGDRELYRYHPLFLEFLLDKLNEQLEAPEVIEVKRGAVNLLGTEGRPEEAAKLLIDIREWKALSELIMKEAPKFIAEGRNKVIEQWITALPQAVVNESAWLLFWKGICLMPIDPETGNDCLEKALRIFSMQSDRIGMFLSLCGIQDLLLNTGQFQKYHAWIERITGILTEDSTFPTVEIEQRVVMSMVAALTLAQPYNPETAAWVGKGFTMVTANGPVPFQIRFATGMHLCIYYLWMGEFVKAARVITVLRDMHRHAPVPDILSVMMRVQEVLYALFTSPPDICIGHVSEALAFTGKCGIRLWDNHLAICGMLAALRSGDSKLFETFRKCVIVEKTSLFDHGFYLYTLANELQAKGSLTIALETQRAATEFFFLSDFYVSFTMFSLKMAELLDRHGDEPSSLDWLLKAEEYGHAMKSAFYAYHLLQFKAHKAFAKGDRTLGLKLLEESFAVGREQDYSRSLWIVPYFLIDLCIIALEEKIHADYALKLIRAHRLSPDSPPLHIQNWPYPIRIHTLGRFELFRDETPITSKGKAQKKPLELLKALIALGVKDIPVDRVIDALWPESEGDLARKSFDTTLHRLRQLLGSEDFVRLHDGYLSLDARACYADTLALEHLFDKSENLLSEVDVVSAGRMVDSVLDLYRGHFLPGEAGLPWTNSIRDRLRTKFIRFIVRAGSRFEASEHWEEARDCFSKGLIADEYCEEFYQHLMLSAGRLGLESEVLKIYQRCRDLLRAGLETEPSSKTRELFSELTQIKEE